MSYTKLGNWNDVPTGSSIPSGTTPLSAQTMKHLEDGISNAHIDIATLGKRLISDTVDIETGTYVGNGEDCSDGSHPTIISFKKGKPLFVAILRDGHKSSTTYGWSYEPRFFGIYGIPAVVVASGDGQCSSMVHLTWDEDRLRLWGYNNAETQMNKSGETYYWLAIVKRKG